MREPEPLVVVDRRHGRQSEPVVEAVAPEVEMEAPLKTLEIKGSPRKWKCKAYMVTAVAGPPVGPGHPPTPIYVGRGFGVREDGFAVVSDYVLPVFYPKDFDWTEAVDLQMQTYLGCKCSEEGPCERHAELIPRWSKDGFSRWQLEMINEPAEAVELVCAAEARRKTGIVIPGR